MISLLFLFVSSGSAMEDRPRGSACPEQDWAMDHITISDLDLAPEQTKKVQSLTESFYKALAPLRTQKFQLHTELRLLWMQEKPDIEKIKAKQKDLHDLKWRILEKVTDYRFAFREILTPEQLSKFLVQRCNRPFGPRRGGWHHGPHDGREE